MALGAALVAAAAAAPPAARAQSGGPSSFEIVLSGEDNRLNIYDATTGTKRTLIPSALDDPVAGLDINAEICIVPDGVPWKPDGETWFIAGEDTEQNSEPGVIKQGWGIFLLTGDTFEGLQATQIAKLVPDSFVTTASNPENYGCGVLPDGRVVTGDVGDQLPHQPATGQLIEWFIDASHIGPAIGPDRNDFVRVPHCKIDVAIGTAGGIQVDGDSVLIASNRPSLEGQQPGGVLRYDTTDWPTGETPADGCTRTDATGAALADEDRVGRSTFLIQGVSLAFTPSDIVASGRGTFYVSSVFTGQVAEFGADGIFQRFVVTTTGQLGGITPFGLTVTSDGSLWVADIGIVGDGPAAEAGSVVRVPFDAAGQPAALEVIDEGLEFPDGLGAVGLTGPAAPSVPTTAATPTSAEATVAGATLPATGGGLGATSALALAGAAVVLGALSRRGRAAGRAV